MLDRERELQYTTHPGGIMATKRYQHTVQLSEELEQGWLALKQQGGAESFNALVHRLIRQEMELLCVTTTRT